LALVIGLAGLDPGVLASAEQARSADSFVDSLGINIHMHYTDTPYNSLYSVWKQELINLGFRHVRDGFVDTTWTTYYTRYGDLADNGIHGDFIATGSGATSIKVANRLVLGRATPDVVEAFEGQNEIISIYNGTNDATHAAAARAFQADVYNTVKADPVWSTTPVLAPTIVGSAAATLVSAWIKPLAGVSNIYSIIVNQAPDVANGYGLYLNTYQTADGKLVFETANGTDKRTVRSFAGAVTFGVWNHVAAVVDRTAGTVRVHSSHDPAGRSIPGPETPVGGGSQGRAGGQRFAGKRAAADAAGAIAR
jgi:hypothetical protein